MPRKRPQTAAEEETIGPRPLWSGVIAFGLVSLPVSLFPAHRSRTSGLTMVDKHGAQLRRQFFSAANNRPLDPDQLVRGYRRNDNYIVVEDDELQALEPKKSREIDLRSFVPLTQIDPIFFERAYFIVPDKGATKPYRLLARSMEQAKRAGIATFVMRDREYLVAIIAEQGILRAETLRFSDEIRTPDTIGLPPSPIAEDPKAKKLDGVSKKEIAPFEKAIKAMTRKQFESDDLIDHSASSLQALALKKFARHKDVIAPPATEAQAAPDNVIDLMQILKERLQGSTPPAEKATKPTKPATAKRTAASKTSATKSTKPAQRSTATRPKKKRVRSKKSG